MKLKIIACKIFEKELASVTWCSPNIIDVTMIRQDYHVYPKKLHEVLQEEIDLFESGNDSHSNIGEDYDAIVIAYGLCSNCLVGIHSSKYPLVIPRAHDCNTIFLGSKEKYTETFTTYPGSFFYNQTWMKLGKLSDETDLERKYNEYMEKFDDEDTVEYLLEMDKAMLKNYKHAIYMLWPDFAEQTYRDQVAERAAEKGWDYIEVDGSNRLLKNMVDGKWDESDFLIVQPGQQVVAENGELIIKAVPYEPLEEEE